MKGLASLAVVVALALGAVACSDDDAPGSSPSTSERGPTTTSSTSSTEATTTAPAAPVGLQPGDRYVALGSSIASGFGIPVQSTSCGRSDRNYPRLLAAELDLELTDVSCGAALVANVADTPQGENPPQLTALTEDTKLVTLSIGGNDVLYNGTALGCGDPATVCTTPADLDDRFAQLTGDLADLIERIRAAAPAATLVFVANPREVPEEGGCEALSMTDEELAVVRDIGERLEAVFREVLDGTDVVLVDPYVVPGDHTACAAEDERWTAGFDAPDSFAYHPTALGHEVMTEMVIEALEG
jgi:lysophospholipase L1-like esterase